MKAAHDPDSMDVHGVEPGEVDLRPEPASPGRTIVPKEWSCSWWQTGWTAECGKPALPYVCGSRCDDHSPATLAGRSVPVPNPEWTARAFRERAARQRDPLDTLPDQCPHEEPKGPRYCALCRRDARKERP